MTIKILTDLVNDLHAVANKLHLGYTRADEDRVTVNKNDLAELKAGLEAASAHLEALGKDVEAGDRGDAEKPQADVEGKPAAGGAAAASVTGEEATGSSPAAAGSEAAAGTAGSQQGTTSQAGEVS